MNPALPHPKVRWPKGAERYPIPNLHAEQTLLLNDVDKSDAVAGGIPISELRNADGPFTQGWGGDKLRGGWIIFPPGQKEWGCIPPREKMILKSFVRSDLKICF